MSETTKPAAPRKSEQTTTPIDPVDLPEVIAVDPAPRGGPDQHPAITQEHPEDATAPGLEENGYEQSGTSPPSLSPLEETRRAINLLFEPGQVVEVRIPNRGRTTASGYFNDPDRLAKAIQKYDGKAEGIYYTLNPVNTALLARANNRIKEYLKSTTSDTDIICRRWLLVDVDPNRPAGISSTDEEKEKAEAVACAIEAYLHDHLKWPAPVRTDSGNGYHLLYRIDLLNDSESKTLVEGCLRVLAGRFSTPDVCVDTSVGNAARIVKAYGTLARKGDNMAISGLRMVCSHSGGQAVQAPFSPDLVVTSSG
jgi:hypothetical protein